MKYVAVNVFLRKELYKSLRFKAKSLFDNKSKFPKHKSPESSLRIKVDKNKNILNINQNIF